MPIANSAFAQELRSHLETVEGKLQEAVAQADALADDASRHLVSAGGKRLRPLLTLLAAELGAGVNEDVLAAATVVELTHLATLYHDDVMDSAPVRRGAPSAHEVWGNSVAILTGDLLFARASRIVAQLGPEAVLLQAETFERLCLGQLRESVGPTGDEDPIDHYLGVLADKTGSLIATSARFGALFANAAAEHIAALVRFGEKIGVAFQLADDVIDLASDGETTGKTPGTDLRERVPTMPVLLLEAAGRKTDCDAQTRDVLALLEADLDDDAALAAAITALRAHPALEEARLIARQWAQDAISELDALPAGEVRDALTTFAGALVDRTA
ncbi:MAG TPA: polyprenyl synthetase family protein [Actinomycetales bacterium]|nr:polyprenyl synthetase family protein [Actinomycetales bacterium]